MDSDKTNSKVRDFDLNIPYMEEEDVDLNAQNEFPLNIITDTHQPPQDGTNEEVMMMEDANKVDNNEVQQSLEVDTHVQSNSAASQDSREVDPDYIPHVSFASVKIAKRPRSSRGFAPKMNEKNASKGENEVHQSSKVDTTIEANSGASEDVKHKEPKYIAFSSAPVRISQQRPSHHQHHRGGEVQKSTTNSEVFCTNFVCKTKETPMWRRGPLGPRTLCNACGLQYVKIVKGKGSVKGGAVEDYDEDEDDAFTDTVPAETAEGDSNI